MMAWCDVFFGGWAAWRRLRGGRWERVGPTCVCPIDSWQRVDLFRSGHWPTVIAREDHRAR